MNTQILYKLNNGSRSFIFFQPFFDFPRTVSEYLVTPVFSYKS